MTAEPLRIARQYPSLDIRAFFALLLKASSSALVNLIFISRVLFK